MLQKTAVFGLAMLFVMTAFTGCLSSDDDEEIQKVHPAMKSFNLKLASSVDVIAYHNKAMIILDNSQ